MFEFLVCSMVTILPDYLVRRYAQGKRWGAEITVFSMWYELRWGITACILLTVSLITVIFYYHPATSNVSSFFRTVTILPEAGGRVAEVLVENYDEVTAGDLLFRLDDAGQRAAVEEARTRIAEIDAQMAVTQSDLAAAEGNLVQAEGSYRQALDEFETKSQLSTSSGTAVVSERELERLEIAVDSRKGALDAASAARDATRARLETLLPAQKASAEAALAAAEVELRKTEIRAGIDGEVTQFVLAVGDYVSPVLRPAGIIVPNGGVTSGHVRIQAGFGQISAQVVKPGVMAEVVCVSKPFTVVPMVIVDVQDVIAAGQIRPTDQLVEIEDRARPGTVTVNMEPLYEGQMEDIPPGSKCIANAYTSFHDRLAEAELSLGQFLFY
ncbi:MAG: HlyD family secretion protein, partial [Pikeienuella sp.]